MARGRGRAARSMTQSLMVRPALSAAAVLLLVFAVALGSSRSLAHVGGPGHILNAQLITGDLGVGLAVLVLAVLAGIGYALWGGRRRKRRDDEPVLVYERPPMQWWERPLVLVLALLPVAALATAVVLTTHQAQRTGAGRTAVPAATTAHPAVHPGPSAPGPPGATATVHWWAWAALAGGVLAAAAIVAVRRRLGQARDGHAREAVPRWVTAAIEDSLDEIERESDPRRAVIRAYVGMERALARHGLGRRPFEAPQEYLARALVKFRVSRPAGERLTRLFQQARFSDHPIAVQMKQDAITALVAIRDELTAGQQ